MNKLVKVNYEDTNRATEDLNRIELEDVEISVQDEITDLIADESNYTNEDRKCECMKCEMQSFCMYKDKHQRLDAGLKLCFKLKENQAELRAFIGSHLEDYRTIVDSRRTKREFVGNQLKDMLVALNINVVDCQYFINIYNREAVKITYANNSYKNICIDGDSLVAIVSDVIKKVV